MTGSEWAVAVGASAAGPLTERRALVQEVTGSQARVLSSTRDLLRFVQAARASDRGAYLLDVNAVTVRAALALRAAGVPYVLDTGDDPGALALGMERSSRSAAARRLAEGLALRSARVVVCRGWFHRLVLATRTSAPVVWAPDTAPDWLYELPRPAAQTVDLCTFGSTGVPRRQFPHVYGQEVVEAVARTTSLTGLVIGRGPGLSYLRHRAQEAGCASRLELQEALPLDQLAVRAATARFLTSWQSDDLAGWVRTTGKLPLALAVGACLVSTAVGEAARVLPKDLLIGADGDPVAQILCVVERGVPAGWDVAARQLAETYRRSAVAARLRANLQAWT